jgi:hypothetical protein
MSALKAGVAGVKHDISARHAENRAEDLEWEAGYAIDYAIASVEQAKCAVRRYRRPRRGRGSQACVAPIVQNWRMP